MLRLAPSDIREFFGRIPTTDLYFLNPLAELRRTDDRIPPPRCLAANVYLIGRTGVIVRYGGPADIELLRSAGASRIVYVVDDDFIAGGADAGLPERYRAKLRTFAEGDWPRLKETADIVIVPGSVLAHVYGRKALIMRPVWNQQPATTEHFVGARRIEIVHLGSASHRSDLAPLAPLLDKVLRAHPRARLTLFAGDNAPEPLKRHPQVVSRRPLAWWRYRRALPRMRFHLALYPLAPTPFNHARSANKLYEHALVGAASLMSPNPALRAAAGTDLADIFVEDGAENWGRRIEAALAHPGGMSSRVEATYAQIIATDPLAAAARQWREILAPDL